MTKHAPPPSRTVVVKGRLYFAYATCRTREKAEATLEEMYADGDTMPGTIIARNGTHWSVLEPIDY